MLFRLEWEPAQTLIIGVEAAPFSQVCLGIDELGAWAAEVKAYLLEVSGQS
jgi:hypothetical protein